MEGESRHQRPGERRQRRAGERMQRSQRRHSKGGRGEEAEERRQRRAGEGNATWKGRTKTGHDDLPGILM